MPTVKKVPLGKAIIWSKDDLKQLGSVNPKDVALAKLYWRRLAPRRYRNVLDTTTNGGRGPKTTIAGGAGAPATKQAAK